MYFGRRVPMLWTNLMPPYSALKMQAAGSSEKLVRCTKLFGNHSRCNRKSQTHTQNCHLTLNTRTASYVGNTPSWDRGPLRLLTSPQCGLLAGTVPSVCTTLYTFYRYGLNWLSGAGMCVRRTPYFLGGTISRLRKRGNGIVPQLLDCS